MNTHNSTRMDHQQIHRDKPGDTTNNGLWKLFVAAMLIIAGMVALMEIFGNAGNEFVSRDREPQTIVQ